MFFLVSPTV